MTSAVLFSTGDKAQARLQAKEHMRALQKTKNDLLEENREVLKQNRELKARNADAQRKLSEVCAVPNSNTQTHSRDHIEIILINLLA